VKEIHTRQTRKEASMTNFELLEEIMSKSGATIDAVAKAAHFSRETYYNRKKGIGEFTASEIARITNCLRLTTEERDAIFLSGNVN
jgi:hypothetical protein